ncbi:hypothetical protein F4860DRAFT_529133 [Xylaria cubensis]|nr:hypothetical protein F4860DRAFT_529133 [Xylaria cubensis]
MDCATQNLWGRWCSTIGNLWYTAVAEANLDDVDMASTILIRQRTIFDKAVGILANLQCRPTEAPEGQGVVESYLVSERITHLVRRLREESRARGVHSPIIEAVTMVVATIISHGDHPYGTVLASSYEVAKIDEPWGPSNSVEPLITSSMLSLMAPRTPSHPLHTCRDGNACIRYVIESPARPPRPQRPSLPTLQRSTPQRW